MIHSIQRIVILTALLMLAAALRAATIRTADGGELEGKLTALENGVLHLEARDAAGAPQQARLPLDEVVSIAFGAQPALRAKSGAALVVDNDGPHPTKMEMGTIGLKAGKHEIHLLYFQTKEDRALRLNWSGPGFSTRPIPEAALSHLAPGAPRVLSPGQTADGLRLPEPVGENVKKMLEFTYCENPGPRPWEHAADILAIAPKTSGFAGRIDLAPAERKEDFGLIFNGYLDVPTDGQYTFYLTSSKGSQFYIGPMPQPKAVALAPPTTQALPAATQSQRDALWRIVLVNGDRLTAAIAQWSPDALTLQRPGEEAALSVPLEQVREIWTGGKDKPADAVKPEPSAEDTAWIAKDGKTQSVKGVAVGLSGEALTFRYQDADRKIALDRLVGVVMAAREVKANHSLQERMTLTNGDAVTGTLVAVDADALTLQTPWGARLTLPLAQVSRLDVCNGRLLYLSDLAPAKVEQTPFFDRVIPYRLDVSLDGGRISMLDGEHDKGIAVHSRCVLQYDIGGQYALLKAKVGFQQPEGLAGAARVRVLGDGKPLFEEADLRGDQPPRELALKLNDVKQLTLEVDFGRNQDVADHVIWADARLLRAR